MLSFDRVPTLVLPSSADTATVSLWFRMVRPWFACGVVRYFIPVECLKCDMVVPGCSGSVLADSSEAVTVLVMGADYYHSPLLSM